MEGSTACNSWLSGNNDSGNAVKTWYPTVCCNTRRWDFTIVLANTAYFFAYYWSLGVETEPPNKDSFVLSVSFCIEAYGMNLDGTNLVIEAEHEEFLGKAATSNEVGKMHIYKRVKYKETLSILWADVLYCVRKKERARRLSPGDSLTTSLLELFYKKSSRCHLTLINNQKLADYVRLSCIKLTFSMDIHHTDNNSDKLQLKFSLLVQVSGKFELEGAIFELFSGTGVIEVPKHKSNEGEYAGGFCSSR
uniref:Uncharacterized protein n=1 Tax=Salix viminalis TaxID=40686 RepID=A0A6N2KKU5_SALVM